MFSQDTASYEIIVEGQLDPLWVDWFYGLEISPFLPGQTRLCGPVADQPALRALLDRIFDLNLNLLSVRRM